MMFHRLMARAANNDTRYVLASARHGVVSQSHLLVRAYKSGTSQLVTWSTRHTEKSCDELAVLVREPKLIFRLNPIFSDIVFFWVVYGGIGPK